MSAFDLKPHCEQHNARRSSRSKGLENVEGIAAVEGIEMIPYGHST